jgi:hypothetical protein
MTDDIVTAWADREFKSRTEALAYLDSWIMLLERSMSRFPPNELLTAHSLREFIWVCRSDLIVAGLEKRA